MLIRTPEERFQNLPDFPFESKYVELGNTRIHYIEEGEGHPILCLHGEPSWCFLYRKMLPTLSKMGRAIAFDFPGFGKSDKYTTRKAYTFELFYNCLQQFIEVLDLHNITLVVQDWGGLIGIPYAVDFAERIDRIVIMNTGLPSGLTLKNARYNLRNGWGFIWWQVESQLYLDMPVGDVIANATRRKMSPEVKAAYDAPFPDKSYKAGAHEWPTLVPTFNSNNPIAKKFKETKQHLQSWNKPTKLIFSDGDPVTKGQHLMFEKLIPKAVLAPTTIIRNAGHFLQEDAGEEIAELIAEWMR